MIVFSGFTERKSFFIVLNNKVYFDISVSIEDIKIIYYIKKKQNWVLVNCCHEIFGVNPI